MTDAEIIEKAKEAAENAYYGNEAAFVERDRWAAVVRAVLAVAEPGICEKCAEIADSYAGGCYEGIAEMIAADIRKGANNEH